PAASQPSNVLANGACPDLLNGLNAATRVYDANGNLVAWSFQCWYGVINVSATPTSNSVYPGTYVSVLQSVRIQNCAQLGPVVNVTSDDLEDLQQGTVPASLQT